MPVNREDVKTKKHYYKTWEQRLAVVKDSKRDNNLSETARKHGITREKIKEWEKNLKKIAEQCDSMKEYHAHLKKKSFAIGRSRKDKDLDKLLKSFIEFMNNNGLSVNVPLLVRKVKENKPSTINESDNAIKLRIRLFQGWSCHFDD